MLLSEISAIISSRRSKRTILICVLIVLLAEFLAWQSNFPGLFQLYPNGIPSKEIINPPTAAFLAGNSSGQFLQIILIWFMPIFIIMITLQRIIERTHGGSNYLLSTRMGTLDKFFVRSELVQFFIFSTFYMILFGCDFVVAIILFHKGTSFMGMEDSAKYSHLLHLEIEHPYVAYILFVIIVSLAFGLFSVVIYVLALSIRKTILVYPISLGLWIFMIALPYSSSYFTQPFIEYDWNEYIGSLISFLLICVVVITIGNVVIRLRSKHVYFK
ncbi:hypothetical protein [Lentilactobacillus buchneri]|uniref:ABC-2 family transporter protein n=1 Tax=Lentilactobacillus buchneri subsp. silagei CD034 TaxID=1071400 RepID=J9WBH7_LENBU|nr:MULTISPECIES: hypothetical protein [Lentilactobacillus]AFS01351.1 hypothetical protein LBUCD034_2384 [Lentilactobacillus buchneri subsp. silagei CD034]MCC6102039.1 hypothetical protein [Lactobacillus sp.]MCV3742295.1 hypothetical protein [Lentilactobacillus hilgardii]